MFGIMGKWIFKSLLTMAFMFGASSYLMYLKTGHTPWALLGINSFSDLTSRVSTPSVPADLQSLTQQLTEKMSAVGDGASDLVPEGVADILPDMSSESEPTTVYKWVDANGVTHFGEAPPKDVQAQQIVVDANRNIIQSSAKKTSQQAQTANAAPLTQATDVQRIIDEAEARRQQAMDNP